MKKKMVLLSCLLLLLSGCGGKADSKTEPPQQSKVVELGVEDAIGKLEQKQTFVLLVTRKKCEYCEAMLEMLDQTIQQHTLVIYNAVTRDDTADHLNEDIKKLEAYLDRPDQTPHYYYIKDGEVMDADKGYTQFQPERFWDWVTKNEVEGLQ